MLYAKLETDDTLYIFLHAEQVYRNFRQSNEDLGYFGKKGYFSRNVEESTMCVIYNHIVNNILPNNIIVDCAEVEGAHNIALWVEKIIKFCLEKNKNLAFSRMGETLYGESKLHGMGLSEQSNNDKSYNVYTHGCVKRNVTDAEIYDIYQQLLAIQIKANHIIER